MAELAVRGGTSVRPQGYPSWPVYDERDAEAVAAVVRGGNWGGFPEPGPNAADFESRFAAYQGAAHGIFHYEVGQCKDNLRCQKRGQHQSPATLPDEPRQGTHDDGIDAITRGMQAQLSRRHGTVGDQPRPPFVIVQRIERS